MCDLSTVHVQYLRDKIFYGTIPCNCSHSLMDRMQVKYSGRLFERLCDIFGVYEQKYPQPEQRL